MLNIQYIKYFHAISDYRVDYYRERRQDILIKSASVFEEPNYQI